MGGGGLRRGRPRRAGRVPWPPRPRKKRGAGKRRERGSPRRGEGRPNEHEAAILGGEGIVEGRERKIARRELEESREVVFGVGDDKWAPPGAVAVTVRALRAASGAHGGHWGRLGRTPRGWPRMEVGHAGGGKERGEPRLARPPRFARPQGEGERREGEKKKRFLSFLIYLSNLCFSSSSSLKCMFHRFTQ
jgi:hypothetical protein